MDILWRIMVPILYLCPRYLRVEGEPYLIQMDFNIPREFAEVREMMLDCLRRFLVGRGYNLCFEGLADWELPDEKGMPTSILLTFKLKVAFHDGKPLKDINGNYRWPSVRTPMANVLSILNFDRVPGVREPFGGLEAGLCQFVWDTISPEPLDAFFHECYQNYESRLDSISIQKYFAIEGQSIDLLSGSQEIYFLGENGDGKTLVLQAIHLAHGGEWQLSEFGGGNRRPILTNLLAEARISAIDSRGIQHAPHFRFHLPNLYAYGPNRGLESGDNGTYDESGFLSLYSSDVYLFSPVALLRYAKTAKELKKGNGHGPKLGKIAREELIAFFEYLLAHDDEPETPDVKVVEVESLEEFMFVERGAKVTFRNLSEGYKSILIWVSDLLMRLQRRHPDVTKIEDFHAIVLVDEIDLHLHPRWQNTFVRRLREWFKKVQFVFTTHSPSMVQGASPDAMFFRVYRDAETGNTKISEPYYKKEMEGMMYNTLVTSPLFGLESARIQENGGVPDTRDSFLHSRVAAAVSKRLEAERAKGKSYFSQKEIDALVAEMLDEELSH